LGDTVTALPALWAIRRHFPKAKLALLTNIDRKNPGYISPPDVLPKSGIVDEFIAYPTHTGVITKMKALFQLSVDLRSHRFDRAFYLMPRVRAEEQLKRDRAFFRASGIRSVDGIEFLRKNRLEYPVPFPTPVVERESDFLLGLLRDSGVPSKAVETNLLLTDDEHLAGDAWLAGIVGDQSRRRLIAIAAGAKWNFKCWAEECYINVVSRLMEGLGCFPILFGGSEDRDKCDRIIRALGKGANAAAQLNIRESAAVLRKCSLYLGNDTGTMHLAAAVGVTCVALFSSIDYIGRWSPVGENHQLFRTVSSCNGCSARGEEFNHTCMQSIGTDEVFEACLEVFDRES
jgi:heptosyltransferase-3